MKLLNFELSFLNLKTLAQLKLYLAYVTTNTVLAASVLIYI